METHKKNKQGEFFARSESESQNDSSLREIFRSNFPTDTPQWNHHFQVYLKRHNIMRLLHFDMLYRKIVEVPGDILDFGVHYGASSSTLINLRSIYEPYNVSRRLFVFDTFDGLTGVTKADGQAEKGGYAVPSSYENVLEQILTMHESFAPNSHMKRFQIIKGDARDTFSEWLISNPGSLIALLHLDMDLYEPTLEVLRKAKGRLTKGSIVVFDELTANFFPGEAVAMMEAIGAENVSLRRSHFQPYSAWFVID
jgi:hypothetical protein